MFVGIWPPVEIVERIAALERAEDSSVRWTGPDNWHVTLRFLGEIGDDDLVVATAAIENRLKKETAPRVVLGPATRRLNPTVLAIPSTGSTHWRRR